MGSWPLVLQVGADGWLFFFSSPFCGEKILRMVRRQTTSFWIGSSKSRGGHGAFPKKKGIERKRGVNFFGLDSDFWRLFSFLKKYLPKKQMRNIKLSSFFFCCCCCCCCLCCCLCCLCCLCCCCCWKFQEFIRRVASCCQCWKIQKLGGRTPAPPNV